MDTSALLQKVLEVVIQVALPFVLAMLFAWLRQQYLKVKAQIPVEQFEFAANLAEQFVLAAEQTGLKDELLKLGQDKKEWVLSHLDAELQKRGVKLDLAVLSALVESAVYSAITMFKEDQP